MTASHLRPFSDSSWPLRSPWSVSTFSTPSASRLPRLKWVTFQPRASACSVRCGPMKPVPPRISIVCSPAWAAMRPAASARAVPAPALMTLRRVWFISCSMFSACAGGRVPREPVLHFAVPEQRVLALQDPVVLVREIDQAARHAAVLQRLEQLHAVVERHALVELAVQHERGGLEIGGSRVRRVAGELLRPLPML